VVPKLAGGGQVSYTHLFSRVRFSEGLPILWLIVNTNSIGLVTLASVVQKDARSGRNIFLKLVKKSVVHPVGVSLQ
jgi:hypothetical protein